MPVRPSATTIPLFWLASAHSSVGVGGAVADVAHDVGDQPQHDAALALGGGDRLRHGVEDLVDRQAVQPVRADREVDLGVAHVLALLVGGEVGTRRWKSSGCLSAAEQAR
jgi:hypothetical protein